MMYTCISYLTIIGSDNGLSPERRQAIIWTNAGILLIGTLGINFSDILMEINILSFKKMHLKMSSGKCRPFCLGLNELSRDKEEKSGQMTAPMVCPSTHYSHKEHDGISNHQSHACLLNRVFRCRSKKTSKLHVTGLCVGNSPVTGEFPAQRVSNVENVSIWWRHHAANEWFRCVGDWNIGQ